MREKLCNLNGSGIFFFKKKCRQIIGEVESKNDGSQRQEKS